MKKKFDLDALLGKPTQISERYHNSTKLKPNQKEADIAEWPSSWKKIYFKSYPRFDEVLMPQPQLNKNISLRDIIVKRTSKRAFAKTPLSLKQLSTLLYYSSGLKNTSDPDKGRFYPSAGARYPLEIYLLSVNTEIPNGLYHYYLKNHSLEVLFPMKNINVFQYIAPQKWVKNVGCIIFTTAIFPRTTMKYGQRGYRHVLTESGALLQNLLLVSTALKIGCCPVASYIDQKINTLLDIDGVEEAVVNTVLFGNS